jgi:hypothetical protein
MSFLPHSSRGRHAVDEQPADGERIDGEEPAVTAPDVQQPSGGQAGERPRYAFGYAPDDAAEDDAVDGNAMDGNVVRGDVVREDEDGDYPPVTVSDVPGHTGMDSTATDSTGTDSTGTDSTATDSTATDSTATDSTGPIGTPAAAAPTVGVPAMAADRGADGTETPVPAPRAASEYEPTPTFEPATGYEPGARETAAAGTGLDEPLLADATGLRARWQHAQANFVDDPRAAVTDAAALVEQTAQALTAGLERRQRQLREQWERGQAGDPNAPAGEPSDTERLRLTMQRYRALFDQLCVR